MTTAAMREPRRLKAALIGLGLDAEGSPRRIITGQDCLILGGSEETMAEMVETMLRLDLELERRGQCLGEVAPDDLAEIAWRIDSPELHAIAERLGGGLEQRGLTFAETSPEELNELACDPDR